MLPTNPISSNEPKVSQHGSGAAPRPGAQGSKKVRWGFLLRSWVLLLFWCGPPLAAQEVKLFEVTDIYGQLELRMFNEMEERERQGGGASFDSEELEFSEILELNLDGYVYHPNLLNFQVGVLTEYLQESFSGTNVTVDRRDSLNLGGDFRLTLLEQLPYTLSLFGNRRESDVGSAFGEDYTLTTSSLGGRFIFTKGPLPFSVSYAHSSRKASDPTLALGEVRDDVRARTSYTLGDRSKGSMAYEWSKQRGDRSGTQLTSQEFKLDNTTLMGPDDRVRLRSAFHLRDQTGLSETTNLSVRENLSWRIKDNLTSMYALGFDQTETFSMTTTDWSGQASVVHRLFDSLVTSAQAFGNFVETDASEQTIYGGRLTETYTKRLQNWGRLVASLSGGVRMEERQDGPLSSSEAATTSNPASVLDDRDTSPWTAFAGTPLAGLDPLAGGIVDLAATRANGNGAESTLLTTTLNFSPRLELWQWLTLYGRYELNEQELLSGATATRLESRKLYEVGGEVRWRFLQAEIEYENIDSVFSPVETISETVSLSRLFFRKWQTQLRGSHRNSTFSETAEQLEAWNLGASLGARVTTRSDLSIEAEYRNQEWEGRSSDNDLEGYSVRAGYSWRYRNLEVEAKATLSHLKQRGQVEDRRELELSVTRTF